MPLPEWTDQLAATAMLGTDRAGNAPLTTPGTAILDPLIEKIPPTPPEHALLSAAALAAIYTKAGTIPAQIASLPPTAPPADKPPVSHASAQHLAMMLKDLHAEVLPEYLDLVARAHRSLPSKHLPALLSLAARDEKLRPHILSILGPRGQWLAAQNPDWSNLNVTPDPDLYHTGTPAERLAVLRHLRQTNPAQARTLITSTWSEEKPEDRAAFLETLATNLSMEDEPFLESALDDKRKEVRTAAAELLARLTDSRLATRMMARLTPLVTLTKKLLGKNKLTIEVPDSHDPTMARDGIDAKSSHAGLGDKASHLADIIAATPLSFWNTTIANGAPGILNFLAALEWKQAILAGLATAALRQKDATLAAALLTHVVTVSNDARFDLQHLPGLMQLLTPAQRETSLTPLLANKSLYDSHLLYQLLSHADHPWSKSFSDRFLPLFWHILQPGQRHYLGIQGLAKEFAARVDPSILATITPRLQADDSIRSDHLDKFLATLQFRHDLQKELT